MERPAKRQKLSSIETISYQQYPSTTVGSLSDLIGFSTPSRTLDLADFQRPSLIFETQNYPKSPQRRRNPGRVILPRAPDVTVTTGVLEVAVNDGSTSTQIAVPTTDVAVSLSSLGTLTVPAQTTSSGLPSSSGSGSASSSASTSSSNVVSGSSDLSSTTARNTTTLLSSVTERTATVTATSTFHVSYINGTFIAATSSSRQSGTSISNSNSLSRTSTSHSSSTKGSFSFDPDQTSISDTTGVPTGGDYTAGTSATATGSGPHGSSTSGSSSAGGGGGGGSGSGGGDNGGSSGPALTPQQTQMVGGIVGGLAGVALIAFAILYVLRWYRQRLASQSGLKRLVDFDPAHDHHKTSGLTNTATTMSSTSHSSFFPAAGALLTSSKNWRTGFETVNRSGTMSPRESEKGFQRIAGRKIPPVLSTGGDQYGDSQSSFFHNNGSAFDEKVGVAISTPTRQETFTNLNNRSNQRVLSDASVYSDYEGMYANSSSIHHYDSFSEPTTPIYSGSAMLNYNGSNDRLRRPPLSHTRSYQDTIALEDLSRALTTDVNIPDGFAVIRNSPARTPVTQSPTASSIVLPIQAPVSMDEDIPEMPLSSGNPAAYGLGLGHDLLARRIPSRVSARSSSSNGRFREELA